MELLKEPRELPSPTHEVIVVLEEVHLAVDHIDTTPRSHEIISYHRIAKADEIRCRIQCASIVIATQAVITAESLGEAPYLRKTVILHNEIRTVDESGDNSWKRQHSLALKMQTANGHPPCSIEDEIVGIIGYGHIGKRLEIFCKALGMEVLVSERKGTGPARSVNERITKRTPFNEVIKKATVLFISCISNKSTRNMIDKAELSAMRPEAIIVNVSRGNVINTEEVIKALRDQRISGAAADVFDQEPASTEEDSAFLAESTKDLNLTFSPHVGYFSTKTVVTMKQMVREQIRNFVNGDFRKFGA
ncbi:hypothetical protein FHL15_001283 [Xylaria flabelliformis]|uniref:D-isomer specific 2-hydroxyacid dehydrogenase NAD-binding domain-containing protein n=1 Tax=Xylaria flabelliformis TaxID=2512241 RepID=A0A553ICY7_9PEZI|nr:hypothetical protein FHL15_001283 [Xylaria flabelliformis]